MRFLPPVPSSSQETGQSKGTRFAVLAVLLASAILPVVVRDDYVLHVLTIAGIWVVATAGLRLVYITGRFSAGQAAFMAIGGYASSLLATGLGINPWLGLLIGGVTAGTLALILGYIVLRVPGVYFIIITICLNEIVRLFLRWWKPVTGGTLGVANIPGFAVGGFEFGVEKMPYYYLMLAITAIALFVMYRIEHSRIGLTFRALGQSDLLAEHVGINMTSYRVLAFVVACFFTGVVGSFFAHYIHYISADDLGLQASIQNQIYAIVGGIGFFVGPIIGPLFLMGLSEALSVAKEVQPIVYGPLLILTMLFLPGGLASLPKAAGSMKEKLFAEARSEPVLADQTPALNQAKASKPDAEFTGVDR